MPIVSANPVSPNQRIVGERIAPSVVEQPPETSVLDVAAAALRQSNVVSSMVAARQDVASVAGLENQANYDVWADIRETPYAEFADKFNGDETSTQATALKRQIDREMLDRRTLDDAGLGGFVASFAAGATDPIFLATMMLPGANLAKGGKAANALRMAAAGAATEVPLELSLQATQVTRTAAEGVLNIGGAAMLSGLLGAALTRSVPAAERVPLESRILDEITPVQPPESSTVGAAASRRVDSVSDNAVAAGAEYYAKTMGKVNPVLRVLSQNDSAEAKQLVQELTETPFMLTKNYEGVASATAVESTLKRYMGEWWRGYKARADLYKAMKSRMIEEGTTQIPSRREFGEMVARSMRRGDASDIAEVAQAAAQTRRLIFDPLKARAQRLGLLGDDVAVTGAESYLMRQYDYNKIKKNMTQWTNTLIEAFKRQGLEQIEAVEVASRVTRHIMGSETGTLDFLNGIPGSGRLKERTLKLPDALLEEFLVNDIDAVTQAYLRTLAPEVEFVERFGSKDLREQIQRIKDGYNIKREQARQKGDNKELQRLESSEKDVLQDIEAIRDRLYGRFGSPKDPSSFFVRGARALRSYNYMRLLGGQVISALTDTARLAMIYGAPKMAVSAVKLATNIKAMKIGAASAKKMGIALDMVLNTRGVAIGELSEFSSFPEQRVMKRMADAFSLLTLQSPWNTVMKSWSSVMSQDDVLSTAIKVANGSKLSKNKAARFAALGLDETAFKRIAKQFEKHGQSESGLRFGNSENWDDEITRELFENAIVKEADTAVMTPGAGDTPLMYSTEWGKTILQFKSFALASSSRLVTPMLQGVRHGDLNTIIGTISMFGFGALVYALKQISADRPISEEPTEFMKEMVDRSGVLAWGGEVMFPMLWQFGNDDLSRWSDRDAVETALGPTVGLAGTAYKDRWPDKMISGEWEEKDIHKIRRLLPGQNIWYWRRGLNALEEEMAQ